MYFQACSNTEYPMHSGERYRTIGPLVSFIKSCWEKLLIKTLKVKTFIDT